MKKKRILSLDIGGSHVKATILDQNGVEIEAYKHAETPHRPGPDNLMETIKKLTSDLGAYDCVSVGFPGFVKNGVIQTAPNLGGDIRKNVNLEKKLGALLGKPTKVFNDADLQGMGIAKGEGFEIVITLGTGFGTAFLKNGILFPHIEFAHHPVTENADYDKYIGDRTLKKIGVQSWNKRMKKVINILMKVFNFDHLYLGGGNARLINFELDKNISMVTNEDGIKGGARPWEKMIRETVT